MIGYVDSKQRNDSSQPTIYHIRIEGHLDEQWADCFGLSITSEKNGSTLLTGPVIDQSALFGLLKKIRDLGMPLISVNRFEPVEARQNRGVANLVGLLKDLATEPTEDTEKTS
jgi:hypothetical protein